MLSPSTRAGHAIGGAIRLAYERHGVPHYWLVDLEQRTIEQFTLQGTPYQDGRYGEPVAFREGDALTSLLFPAVSLPVAAVFHGGDLGMRVIVDPDYDLVSVFMTSVPRTSSARATPFASVGHITHTVGMLAAAAITAL